MAQRMVRTVSPALVLALVFLMVAGGAPSAAAASTPNGFSHPGSPHLSAVAPATPVAARAVGAAAFANKGVLAFGDAPFLGGPSAPLSSPLDGMAADPVSTLAAQSADPTGAGYWLFAADGGVFAYGSAPYEGSAGSIDLYAPIVGMAPTPDGRGYWLVATDGGIFSFGDAAFYGSMGGHHLNFPIMGMAVTPDGRGYWLVAADGGIFAFGDAAFYGSMGAHHLNSPVVGMAATPDGRGYWLVAADGGIFTFGDAAFEGSAGSVPIPNSVVAMASTSDGRGYWLVGSGGSVYPYGDAKSYGDTSKADPAAPVDAIARSPGGQGYWLLEPDAFTVAFSHPAANSAIVQNASEQIQANPYAMLGAFCNPFGPCEEWCALFATWAWESAGIEIPRYAFVGDIYYWAAEHGGVLPPSATPAPGDAVLYGTGPETVATAVHMGIVAQVWPDGAIDTIDGDSGPGPGTHFSVTINGPFLPAFSLNVYNGFDIFAYAVP
jgi:hypothetical protein